MKSTVIEDYQTRKARVIADARALVASGHQLALGKRTSNLFRNRAPASQRIDVSDFNHVLTINTDELWVEVEGMTPFATVVAETLKVGCLPTVVPELKSITVGGALTGVAIESSSFRYGLVHETIIESEILLADGSVVTCTAHNEHRDLFFAFPNTYGSLGYALKVKMKLVRAKPYVRLRHSHFTDPTTCFAQMQAVCVANRNQGAIAFVDGMALAENDLHLTTAEFVDSVPYTSNYQWLQIYYQSIPKRDEDYLTTEDYIWRWDSDWFWCSKNFGMHNKLLRLLVGKWVLHSTCYWKMMRFARNSKVVAWLERTFGERKETIIQDIEVPIHNAEAFHRFFHQSIGIKPVWMCPVQSFDANTHYPFYALTSDTLFVNFGFWDAIASRESDGHYNRLIEAKVGELSGHKSLYSAVYYTEQQFWQLYNREHYQTIKQRYDAVSGLKDWYQKVTEK